MLHKLIDNEAVELWFDGLFYFQHYTLSFNDMVIDVISF